MLFDMKALQGLKIELIKKEEKVGEGDTHTD